MEDFPLMRSIVIKGFRAFGSITVPLGPLEVIIGANGSGKTCLLEFLRFLRDSMEGEIPPGIVANPVGQQVFHIPGLEGIIWDCEIRLDELHPLRYYGIVLGPIGFVKVASEEIFSISADGASGGVFMAIQNQKGVVIEPSHVKEEPQEIEMRRRNQLALGTIQNPSLETLYNLREYIANWRFYSAFNINRTDIRRPVPVEQKPVLREDASNLSSILFYMMTEHNGQFDTLQTHLRSLVPGFKKLSVKARGGPGEVIAFWEETGATTELSLADVSDGILHLLCWLVLCLQPHPPGLLCIDEPDLGVHPRTLPLLAALFQKLSERTQVILTTHSTYFLKQFDLEQIAVMRKENGDAVFVKPSNSAILRANLEDFGWDELEIMHRNDELERFA